MILYETEKAALSLKNFNDLVKILLKNVDLLDQGKSLTPWAKPTARHIRNVIQEAAKHLPLIYQERYSSLLLQNLDSLLLRAKTQRFSQGSRQSERSQFEKTIGILAGAVYCHDPQARASRPLVKSLRCLLAVTSNTYRSFLKTERLRYENIPPLAADRQPPLATFWNSLAKDSGPSVPSMLTSDVVKKLCGGSTGVVVLPTAYKDHPLLWTAVAHEVGGHEMLSAVPQLLPEIQTGIRKLFNLESLRGGSELDEEQRIGLLWQYWAEETFADVCGVLNLGPSYGISLAIYHAALLHALAEQKEFEPSSGLRMWSSRIPPQLLKAFPSLVEEDLAMPELDRHPTDILKLHVVLGVIDNLSFLREDQRREYITLLEDIVKDCANGQTMIQVYGTVQDGASDNWVRMVERQLPLAKMQEAARRVGAYIATAAFDALGRQSLQTIETWDRTDESAAQTIAHSLKDKPSWIGDMGDDAHLLAGATLAFIENPNKYKAVRDALMNALEKSYLRDPVWGGSQFHAVAEYGEVNNENAEAIFAALEATQAASKTLPTQKRKLMKPTMVFHSLNAPQPASRSSKGKGKTASPPLPNGGRHGPRGTGRKPLTAI